MNAFNFQDALNCDNKISKSEKGSINSNIVLNQN